MERVLMTGEDIVAGKAGFQKADLMDYGSLYGMGSYYGEDYTASILVRLAKSTRYDIAMASRQGVRATRRGPAGRGHGRHAARAAGDRSDEVRSAAARLGGERLPCCPRRDCEVAQDGGPVRRMDARLQPRPEAARQTADFLVFSALTTVARRPGVSWSWTQNWPFEPLVGNTPTTSTFRWTWISFCFTFFAFGAVLFIYERYLNDPDQAPMDPVLAEFRPLTRSQRRIGKYFPRRRACCSWCRSRRLDHGALLYDRTSFYGIAIDRYPAVQLPARRSYPVADRLDRAFLDRRRAVSRPGDRRAARKPKGQDFLVDVLFWVTLLIVVGALVGNYLGIMGSIDEDWFWFGNQGLSYIQLGRFWQIGFFAGLVIWSLLVFRALWPSGPRLVAAPRGSSGPAASGSSI